MKQSIKIVAGQQGDGKGLCTVGEMMEYFRQGRPVATNHDLFLEHFPNKYKKGCIIRLPDRPTAADLEALGQAYQGDYDESRNGLIALDECATWLNARNWNDAGRSNMNDILRHMRKRGWNLIFQTQHYDDLDSQVRKAIGQYVTICYNTKSLPFLRRLPFKLHLAVTYRLMNGRMSLLHRKFYMPKWLYPLYDTRQEIMSYYENGLYCYLSPWHLVGWKIPRLTLKKIIISLLTETARIYLYLVANALALWQGTTWQQALIKYNLGTIRQG